MKKHGYRKNGSLLLPVLSFCCFFAGCTRNIPLEVTRRVPLKIPYYEPDLIFRSETVGIYMSPGLRGYEYRLSLKNKDEIFIYSLGERFYEILQTITDSLFDKVYLYDSLEKFEKDYLTGRFQNLLTVKSLEGTVKIDTGSDSWSLLWLSENKPVKTYCRIKAVLVSRKGKKDKATAYPLQASGQDILYPSQAEEEYFASAANQALSQLSSNYAQMILHIF